MNTATHVDPLSIIEKNASLYAKKNVEGFLDDLLYVINIIGIVSDHTNLRLTILNITRPINNPYTLFHYVMTQLNFNDSTSNQYVIHSVEELCDLMNITTNYSNAKLLLQKKSPF